MKIILPMISLILICSCDNSLGKQDYLIWLGEENNGYYTEFNDDEFLISAFRLPSELKALNELKGSTSLDKIDSIANTYDKLQYFQLILKSPLGGNYLDYISSDQDEYFTKQNHLEYYFKNEISLISGKDTILPYIFLPERNYGLRPETVINLGFLVDFEPKAEIFIHSEELKLKGIRLLFISKELPKLKIN